LLFNFSMNKPLLKVENLKKYFPVTKGLVFKKVTGNVKAVDDVSFEIMPGDTMGLVGESGCGKSTTTNMILRLLEPTSGRIMLSGQDVNQIAHKDRLEFCKHVQAVFQDPFRSLNPRKKVKRIISEPFEVHNVNLPEGKWKRVNELLDLVGLEPRHAELYPHEFSGGQRQRIAVARALALDPKVLILDEPVSELNLLLDMQRDLGLTFLIISHDLAVVEHVSTRVGVMYLGKLVELATRDELYNNPTHPYTKALLESVPVADPTNKRKVALYGEVPSPLNPPEGCRFHPRCPEVRKECATNPPLMKEVSEGHYSMCHL